MKFSLSLFSLSKLILVTKKQNYQYTSIVAPPSSMPYALIDEFRGLCVRLAERYIPWCFEMPMRLGFRWLPVWTASSVKTWKNPPFISYKILLRFHGRCGISFPLHSGINLPFSALRRRIKRFRLLPFKYDLCERVVHRTSLLFLRSEALHLPG